MSAAGSADGGRRGGGPHGVEAGCMMGRVSLTGGGGRDQGGVPQEVGVP